MTGPRLLSAMEKRLLADSLRAAAAEARRTRSAAIEGLSIGGKKDSGPAEKTVVIDQLYLDELARRAHNLELLASEVVELDVRLEKVLS